MWWCAKYSEALENEPTSPGPGSWLALQLLPDFTVIPHTPDAVLTPNATLCFLRVLSLLALAIQEGYVWYMWPA